jgi:hypothetical protein
MLTIPLNFMGKLKPLGGNKKVFPKPIVKTQTTAE